MHKLDLLLSLIFPRKARGLIAYQEKEKTLETLRVSRVLVETTELENRGLRVSWCRSVAHGAVQFCRGKTVNRWGAMGFDFERTKTLVRQRVPGTWLRVRGMHILGMILGMGTMVLAVEFGRLTPSKGLS